MKKIKIRFATLNDLDELAKLSALFEEHFCRIDNVCEKKSLKSHKAQIKNLNFSKSPIMRTLVAVLNENIIGAISFYKGFTSDFGTAYHLPYFLIKPEHRGGRTALLFLEELKKLAKKEKINSFIFSVYGKNKSAVKLYKHAGAKYWSEEDEHFMYIKL